MQISACEYDYDYDILWNDVSLNISVKILEMIKIHDKILIKFKENVN